MSVGFTPIFMTSAGGNDVALYPCACASFCAAGGAVYTWGWNIYGELGDGSTTTRKTPGFVNVSGQVVAQVAAGDMTTGVVTVGVYHC